MQRKKRGKMKISSTGYFCIFSFSLRHRFALKSTMNPRCLIYSQREGTFLLFFLHFPREIHVFLIHVIIQDTLEFYFKARLELILLGIVRICDE